MMGAEEGAAAGPGPDESRRALLPEVGKVTVGRVAELRRFWKKR